MDWFRELTKRESRKKILKALEKENLTFTQLLEEVEIARSTLAIHLKELLKNGKIEKFYNTYRITKKAVAEVYIESMIQYLGTVTTHEIVREKLNLPVEFYVSEEIKKYLALAYPWEELFEYLQENHPLVL